MIPEILSWSFLTPNFKTVLNIFYCSSSQSSHHGSGWWSSHIVPRSVLSHACITAPYLVSPLSCMACITAILHVLYVDYHRRITLHITAILHVLYVEDQCNPMYPAWRWVANWACEPACLGTTFTRLTASYGDHRWCANNRSLVIPT